MLWDMAVQHGRRRTQGQVSHLDVEDIGEIFLGVLPDQVESVRNVDRQDGLHIAYSTPNSHADSNYLLNTGCELCLVLPAAGCQGWC